MSDIIHLLPDFVANQIAAGEVIQRPSSVVKELIENAIDAGADNIILVINEAGKTLIQVIDNGKGMSETDARFAFERHATSKITKAEDLFSLVTMGFRGEALASIAAVSQVTLKTRTTEDELGIQVEIEGAKIKETQPVACPSGSNFAIKNLFYNVPARRKFLKSNHSEFNHINTEFERIALAYPKVSFQLVNNKVQLYNLTSGTFKHRIVELCGRKLGQQLLPVEVETILVKLNGFVSAPESAHKTGLHQFFFTNGRYMRNPYFQKAVMLAFDRLIPYGEQVNFFLNLEVDPKKIDINIHPTKTEIKFEDDKAIFQIILVAVRASLGKFNAVPMIDFDTSNKPDIPIFEQDISDNIMGSNQEHTSLDTETNAPSFSPSFSPSSNYNPFNTDVVEHRSYEKPLNKNSESSNTDIYKSEKLITIKGSKKDIDVSLFNDNKAHKESSWSTCSLDCYQYRGQFIITNVQDGLLIVDQYRASLKVLYEKIQRANKKKQATSQPLLFPEMIELTPIKDKFFCKSEKILSTLGFDFSNLGKSSYSINAVPDYAYNVNPILLVESLLDEVEQDHSNLRESLISNLSLNIAKRTALSIGQVLTSKEMSELVNNLFSCGLPNYTPDGKLIYTILSQEKIEKIFN